VQSNPDGPSLPARPYLKPWYRVIRRDGGVTLAYGGSVVALDGAAATRLVPALLPLLDGLHELPEIVERLGPAVAPAVEKALALLARHGLLTSGPPASGLRPHVDAAAALAARFPAAGSPAEVAGLLERLEVSVAGSSAAAAEVARALRLSGVGAVARASWGDAAASLAEGVLAVAAPAPYEGDELDRLDDAARTACAAWLQVLPWDGRIAAVGPLFVPYETACRRCYVLRFEATAGAPQTRGTLPSPYEPSGPALDAAVGALAADLALRWLVTRDPFVPGALFALELAGGPACARHEVLRVPRCPACGSSARIAPALPWAEAA
jgi:bacteriocin biosynthesis cyclodehydratase domain-containing protein